MERAPANAGGTGLEALRPQLEAAADLIADGVLILDAGCAIRYANAGAARIFGAARDEMIGRRCADAPWKLVDCAGTAVPESAHACLRALTTGEAMHGVERTIVRADGSRVVVLANISPVRDGQEHLVGTVATYTDITERKKAEVALQQRCEHDASLLSLYRELGLATSYTDILEALQAELPRVLGYPSVWLCTVDESKEHVYLVQARGEGAHESVESIKSLGGPYRGGTDDDSFLILPVKGDLMLEEVMQATHTVVVEDAYTDPRANREVVAVSHNRTVINRPLILSDRTLGSLGMGTFGDEGPRPPTAAQIEYIDALAPHVAVAMDRVGFLRELARSALALRASEERYRRFIETSIEGVVQIDPEGRIVFASAQMARLLGCEPRELAGTLLLDLVFDEDAPAMRERLAKRRAVGSESYETRFRRCDDASPVWLNLSASPVLDDAGEFLGSFALAADISGRKAAEAALGLEKERLRQVRDGVVLALAATTSQRDPYTALHQERVARLACAIAEEMGLPAGFVEGLRIAALLHDVGKITVPAEILSKPGSLTPLEFGIVRTHAEIGHSMLEHVPFDTPVALAVLQHHERLDGSGYPDGLHGDEILMEARILAVADVVEAMASHRPYRPALGVDAALDEVVAKAGVAFDAEVVRACERVATALVSSF